MRRRALLASATAGLATLAGCSGGGNRISEASDPWRSTTTISGDGRTGLSGQVVLGSGEYAAHTFAESEAFVLGVHAFERLERPLDFLTLRRPALDGYGTGEAPSYLSSATQLDRPLAVVDARLPAGEYAFVFDNTTRGEATPQGEVEVEFELTVTV